MQLFWCDKQAPRFLWKLRGSGINTVRLFAGIIVLLWSTSAAIGQDNSRVAPCAPSGFFDSSLLFGGWIEMGISTNGNSNNGDNGPIHTNSHRRTDFLLNQLYLFGEREMNTKHGFDWGARADFVYGASAPGMQCYGDETFDFDWGTNEHGYGLAAYQLYGTLGYRDLSVKVGKFSTPIGRETAASKDNFFYSHSYSYLMEPTTHTGILATYDLTKRLSLTAGWTTGEDSSFKNTQKSSSLLTGFAYELANNTALHYGFNGGTKKNVKDNYFVQSLCLEWKPADRLTHVIQYDLRNTKDQHGNMWFSAYGINNHLLYKWNERWGAGVRFEWLRNNGDYVDKCPGDYYQITFGLNWKPYKNVSVKPEVRYDWFKGSGAPFSKESRRERVTGGCGVIISF